VINISFEEFTQYLLDKYEHRIFVVPNHNMNVSSLRDLIHVAYNKGNEIGIESSIDEIRKIKEKLKTKAIAKAIGENKEEIQKLREMVEAKKK